MAYYTRFRSAKMMRSRTMWFSFALVVFGALEAGFPYLQSVIDQQYYGIILVTIGVIVAVLRFLTTGPLK
jgi:hypothetical protein